MKGWLKNETYFIIRFSMDLYNLQAVVGNPASNGHYP